MGLNNRDILQRRIGVCYTIVAFVAALFNLGAFLIKSDAVLKQDAFSGFIMCISVIPFVLFTGLMRNKITKIFQVIIFIAVGFVSMFDDIDSIYGYGILMLSFGLMYSYGYLKKRPILKISVISVLLIGAVELLVVLKNYFSPGLNKQGISSILIAYGILFFLGVYLIAKKEIDTDKVKKERDIIALKKEIAVIDCSLNKLKEEKQSLKEELLTYSENQKSLNPSDYGISDAEVKVLRALVELKGTNKEIAYQLGISDNTVRTHFVNIKRKINDHTGEELVLNRSELIELFRYSFSKDEVKV